MSDNFLDSIITYIPYSGKKSGDWQMFNCPACHHRHESRPDTKERCGMKYNVDGSVAFHCFNCNFTTIISPYKQLTNNNKNFLKWLGMSVQEIDEMSLNIIKNKNNGIQSSNIKINNIISIPETYNKIEFPYKTEKLIDIISKPDCPADALEVANYIANRNIKLFSLIPFMWSPDVTKKYNHRFMIPYYNNGVLIGWNARLIDNYIDARNGKYDKNYPKDYMYNSEVLLNSNRKNVFVVEGSIDAKIIDGVAIQTNTISEAQERLLNSYTANKIIIPDRDPSGYKMIEYAIKNGWGVSFPDIFSNDEKDIDDLYKKYNRIFIVERILSNVEINPIMIDLRWKQYMIKNNSKIIKKIKY